MTQAYNAFKGIEVMANVGSVRFVQIDGEDYFLPPYVYWSVSTRFFYTQWQTDKKVTKSFSVKKYLKVRKAFEAIKCFVAENPQLWQTTQLCVQHLEAENKSSTPIEDGVKKIEKPAVVDDPDRMKLQLSLIQGDLREIAQGMKATQDELGKVVLSTNIIVGAVEKLSKTVSGLVEQQSNQSVELMFLIDQVENYFMPIGDIQVVANSAQETAHALMESLRNPVAEEAPVVPNLPELFRTIVPECDKPLVMVVGLNSTLKKQTEDNYEDRLNLKFFEAEQCRTRSFAAAASSAKVVFLMTKFTGHDSEDQLKKARAHLVRINGGLSALRSGMDTFLAEQEEKQLH